MGWLYCLYSWWSFWYG